MPCDKRMFQIIQAKRQELIELHQIALTLDCITESNYEKREAKDRRKEEKNET